MRRFIYYDKDGIESYLAQITAGISISSSNEIEISNEESKTLENKKTINSDIGAKLAGIGKLKFIGAQQVPLNEYWGGVALMYVTTHGEEEDSNPENNEMS